MMCEGTLFFLIEISENIPLERIVIKYEEQYNDKSG